ncbi:MAG: DUF3037 domain-containing protein [Dehalococcoidia bacterium]
MPAESEAWYDYAIVRVVPVVERGEFVNAGIILRARTLNYLDVRIELDEARLLALAPDIDLGVIRSHLEVFDAIAAGDAKGGPISAMTQSQRFHWLTTPRSTVIQTSPAHVGRCSDPQQALEDLMDALVR